MYKPIKKDRIMRGDSENIYKTLFKTLPQRFFSKDKNLVYSACNKSYADDFGKAPDEITGKTDYYLYPKELAEKHRAEDLQVIKSEKTIEFEEEYVKDSQTFWVNKIKTPIKDDKDRIIGILAIVTDITERKRAEEALNASEIRYRRLFEAAKDGILILDAETGMIDDVNPFLIKLLGFSYEDFIGKNIWELGFFKDTIMNKANFLELQQKEYIRYENLPLETTYGHRVDVEFVSNVYQVNHHKVIQCNIRDISDRKRAEDEIKKLAKFPSENPNPVIRSTTDGTITYANNAAINCLKSCKSGINQPLPENLREVLFDVVSSGTNKIVEINFDDKIFTITFHPVLDSGYVNIYGLDITDRKQAEKLLKDSEARYRILFESAGEGILIADIQTKKFIYANPAISNILGYSIEELLGMNVEEVHPQKDLEHVISTFIAQARGEITLAQLPCLRKDGEIVYANITTAKSLIDERECSVGFFTDVTEQKHAEETLKKSEALFRSYFELSGAGIAITSPTTEWIKVNDHLCKMFGYSREELLHKTWLELTYPDDREIDLKHFNQIMTGVRDAYSIDKRFVCKDGKIIWTSLSVHCVRLYDGKVDYFIALIFDITERREAENLLMESKEYLSKIIDAIGDPLFVKDKDFRFSLVNDAFCVFLGKTRNELIGTTGMEFLPPDQMDHFLEVDRMVLSSGEENLCEELLTHQDGTIRTIVTKKTLYVDNQGAKFIVGVIRDITERKKAEEERIRLVTAIEQVSECIVITDVNGTIQYVNPAFEKITGYSGEEAIGQNPRILKSGKQDEAFYKTLWDTILRGNTWNGHFINKKKDDTIYEEKASISPIKDNAGNITNFVAVKRDVTNEVLMEQRQRESQKMEAIGTLAGGIAHDFNNILTGIIGYTELSLDSVPEGSQIHSDLTKIFKAGYRARDLVNQILTFSRQQEQEKRPITIAPVIKESLMLLRASLPSTVEIRQNIESDPGTVLADPTQIHQVIMNLCTNAGYAMREKGGILEVSLYSKELDSEFCLLHPGLVPGHYLILMVSDTGHGIPPEILPRIFEPYFTTNDKSGGTGLGLSVVHGIVTSSGGTVTVYSEAGKGTTFKVYLPVIMEAQVPEVGKIKPVSRGHERILLIDDEKDVVDVGKRILEQLGYTVTIMTSSMEALELFQKDPHQFDLVISDMTMPFMTGDELAEEFMRLRPNIPIIISTGYSEKLTEERALSIGIRAYIGKPPLKSEMSETVRRVLDRKSEEA